MFSMRFNNLRYVQMTFNYQIIYKKVMLVLPIPHPEKPEQHEPWCPLGKPAWVLFDVCHYDLFIKVDASKIIYISC